MSKIKDLAIELGEQQIAQEETGLSLELSISQMDWKPLLDKYNCSSCGMPLSVGMDGRKVCFICRF